jgi:hypothetical protein
MICERCGSTNVRRARSNSLERFLRLFTGKKRFFCKRCGWTALRAWDESAPRVMPKKQEKADLKLVADEANGDGNTAQPPKPDPRL